MEYPTQWWRVAPLVRTGDLLQVAVDNSRDANDREAICLVSPTDEFGADSILVRLPEAASGRSPGAAWTGSSSALRRIQRAASAGVLRGPGQSERRLLGHRREGHPGREHRGGRPAAGQARKFTYRASVRYGDGTRGPGWNRRHPAVEPLGPQPRAPERSPGSPAPGRSGGRSGSRPGCPKAPRTGCACARA